MIDTLDVADLADEADPRHAYALEVPDIERGRRFTTVVGDYPAASGAAPAQGVAAVAGASRVVDGGRIVSLRERFTLGSGSTSAGEKGLRIRLEVPEPTFFRVSVDGQPAGVLELPAQPGFIEVDLALPALSGKAGPHTFVVEARPGTAYRVFHYWLWARP